MMPAASQTLTRMLASVPAKTPCAAVVGVICPVLVSETAVVVVVPLERRPLRKLVRRKPAVPYVCCAAAVSTSTTRNNAPNVRAFRLLNGESRSSSMSLPRFRS